MLAFAGGRAKARRSLSDVFSARVLCSFFVGKKIRPPPTSQSSVASLAAESEHNNLAACFGAGPRV